MSKKKDVDYLIIGAGLTGSVLARELTDRGYKCLVLEAGAVVGGNIRDEFLYGINVHMHGPHIFHTNRSFIWNYVNSFTEFKRFINSPLANYQGEIYNLPFNMNTFRQIYGRECVTPADAKRFIERDIVSCETPKNLEELALSTVGKKIYEKLIKGYTEKQWGKSCTELSPDILKRIPLRFTYDNNYFNSEYQGVPVHGYSDLIEKLLDGVEVVNGYKCTRLSSEWLKRAKNVILTGSIDEYYGYCFGKLNYRSLKIELIYENVGNHQGNAVVNYTGSEVPYTRVTEYKNFVDQEDDSQLTILTRETPIKWKKGKIRYYPVNDEKSDKRYSKYKKLAKKDNLILVGRLAEFKYLNMDEAIENALEMVKSICEKQ